MMRARRSGAAAIAMNAVCVLCAACGDGPAPAADAGAPRGSSATSAPATSAAAASAQAQTAKTAPPVPEGVDLLKFALTSGVKDKDPKDTLDHAKPGQRVYGHITVRNRTEGPKRVSLSFRVNDDERTVVDLNVEKSWSWRTWGYVTLRKDDKGELTVHVFDDHGAELGKQSIPIKP
jgi:hypothetical protein